jgi:hypothetical protein
MVWSFMGYLLGKQLEGDAIALGDRIIEVLPDFS